MGVETGGCPHTAIREDASMNLAAIEDMNRKFPKVIIAWVERQDLTSPEGEKNVHQNSNSQTDEIVQVRCGGSRECDYSAHATRYEQNQRSIRATSVRTRTVPTEDVLDQFLAEPPGQWARVQ